MANQEVKLESFKRGDTPTFRFDFTDPSSGYNWSGVTIDCVMTNVEAPANNSGAAATRIGQVLTEESGSAYFDFTLTASESNALEAGSEYKVEAQLKESGTTVLTPVTAKVKVLQDYAI